MHSPAVLRNAVTELKSITPSFMNTMLEKQSRDEAIERRAAREALVVVNVPPTIPGKDTYGKYCQARMQTSFFEDMYSATKIIHFSKVSAKRYFSQCVFSLINV